MGSFGEKRKKMFFRFCRPILDIFGFPLLKLIRGNNRLEDIHMRLKLKLQSGSMERFLNILTGHLTTNVKNIVYFEN